MPEPPPVTTAMCCSSSPVIFLSCLPLRVPCQRDADRETALLDQHEPTRVFSGIEIEFADYSITAWTRIRKARRHEQGDGRNPRAHRTRHADGQPDAPLLGADPALGRSRRARWSAGARADPRRE